ncbi:carbohydrate-binding module family 13 protein, partial [Wolfiporia cocos MD-104 SS10]
MNQQWKFIESGKGYIIQSMSTAPNGPWYITAQMATWTWGFDVVATPFPATWDIQIDQNTGAVQICWPATDFVFDLHFGNTEPGTRIHLIRHKRGEMCQLWRLIPREKSQYASIPPEHNSQSNSRPTVSVSEDEDF